VLAAAAMSDPNDTVTVRRFDALGQVVAEAARGTKACKQGARVFAGDAATLIEGSFHSATKVTRSTCRRGGMRTI